MICWCAIWFSAKNLEELFKDETIRIFKEELGCLGRLPTQKADEYIPLFPTEEKCIASVITAPPSKESVLVIIKFKITCDDIEALYFKKQDTSRANLVKFYSVERRDNNNFFTLIEEVILNPENRV